MKQPEPHPECPRCRAMQEARKRGGMTRGKQIADMSTKDMTAKAKRKARKP